jgi:asparagine synthase (glutamine-hydrolysing)
VFKKAVARHVPREVVYRPKMGFAVPLARWFRAELAARVRERLLSGALADSGLFEMGSIGRLVSQHQSGLRDHSAVLWSLLIYESFHREVLAA